jgi:FkbM family methyltransferase
VRALRDVGRLLRLGHTEIVAKGVGETPGTLAFTVPLQDSGAISAGQAHAATRDDARDGAEQHVRWRRTSEVEVEVVRLDDVVPQSADVSFIKADIEGAELSAFRGATQIIERSHPTVVCEINPWFLEGFGLTLDDLLAFFTQRGYALYRHVDRRLVAVAQTSEVDEDNYVFVHPERRERFAELI